MDYEDDSGGKQLESEIDMSKDEKVVTENNMIRSDDMCESSRSSPNLKNISMPMSREKNTR